MLLPRGGSCELESGDFWKLLNGWTERLSGLDVRHLKNFASRLYGTRKGFLNDATEVFVEREEREGFGFTEDEAQPLLNAIDGVKEIAAIHLEAAAAEAPIGSEKEVKLEDPEVGFVEIAFSQEVEISHVLFIFAAPHAVAFLAGAGLKSGAAKMFGLFGAFPKPR
jgi:hypothetical protein